jgi:hypothetical protein
MPDAPPAPATGSGDPSVAPDELDDAEDADAAEQER